MSVLDDAGAMARAVELAALGPAHGPNPRVGAVITSPTGEVLGEGWHHGVGTAHAEVKAIEDAAHRGNDIRGATAFVTLEPCAHTGRTGPCVDALTEAGIAVVRYGVPDPNPSARGGGQILLSRGIEATVQPSAAAAELNRRWLAAVGRGRPYVIAKWAQTLDGRSAAADGTSFWITGEQARDHAHTIRAHADAMVVGTGTVLADNPLLSARPNGVESAHQPLRVIMGMRDTAGMKVWRDDNAVAAKTHDPHEVLTLLAEREIRTVVVEGGSVVITAFLAAGLVDEIHAYIAPALLGEGTPAIGSLGIGTMSQALRAQRIESVALGADTLIRALVSDERA